MYEGVKETKQIPEIHIALNVMMSYPHTLKFQCRGVVIDSDSLEPPRPNKLHYLMIDLMSHDSTEALVSKCCEWSEGSSIQLSTLKTVKTCRTQLKIICDKFEPLAYPAILLPQIYSHFRVGFA